MKHLYKSMTLIAAITLLAACVTQRKKDEAKGIKLFFHNLQSKYNGYFNANELIRDASERLEAQHVDNFNKVLDVYPALAVDNPQAAAPDLDKATEKVAVVATYHRPSHWVDDCYLLMGKAQYLKHDFEGAEETLGYLTEMYNPAIKRKRSKQDRAAAAKEAKQEREDAQKEKKQTREDKARELKKLKEEAARDKALIKNAEAKKALIEKEEREKALKKVKADQEKARKKIQKSKKMSIEERNEARRRANEQAAAERKRIRDSKTPRKTDSLANKTTPQYNTNRTAATAKPNVPQEVKEEKDEDEDEDKTAKKDGKKDAKKEEDANKAGTKLKLKGKPDKYILRHRPCYQESVVWYARTLTERQVYSDAELLLNKLDRDPKTFKDVRAMSAVARAHLYLKQKNYDAAIPALESALALSKKKKEKVRLAYILAQVYQERGNNAQAFKNFDRVLDYSPSYEMEFNARLNIALNDEKSTGDDIAATLIKMSKDAKNVDYGAQIYFTLAQIALKKNEKAKCIGYLKEALAAPSRNPKQKAEAYYLMATLENENENYVVAKVYYDSASTTFAANDPRKGNVSLYAGNLLDIARNISIINLQDSLLRLAGLSTKEKREAAARIKKTQLEASKAKFGVGTSGGGKLSDIELAEAAKLSRFFGYDRDNVKRGKKEFEKKWGTDRRLEDNWNRSARRSNGEFNKTGSEEIAATELSAKEVDELLVGVPKTDDEKMAVQDKIEEAMFQLGTLYHDKLQNDKKAIEALDKHLARFPKTKHEVEDYYYLYLAYDGLKDAVKAKEYYDKIQEKFPNSSYARLLKNSDDGKNKNEQTVEAYYATTYGLFKDEKVKEAQDRIPAAETKYGVNNPLKAKFSLLNAMCLGRLKGREAYVTALKEVVAKFPDSPEEKRAQEILRILEFGGPINEAPKASTVDTAVVEDLSTRFAPNDDKLHYVIVILSKNVDMEEAKIIVSDFNSKYFRTEALNISSIFLSTETETGVLVVRKFKDKASSLVYTEGVEKNKKDFLKVEHEVFSVSQDNYREILRQKMVDHYRRFYDKNYKK
ncbi:MAG: tetratricopeptide repeat protein [Saprospiraceae bacterium]|nr:tetratricopeptide repeat protein [Saprospiraceae bacterium]